ncbi:MAG: divalent-cation tolerance protein CutA [Acidobacteriota bacterium]
MPEQCLIVLTTAPSREEGEALARQIVERRLAACVNVSARMRSFFRWNDEVCADEEVQLQIKTTTDGFAPLAAAIRELHSYDLPEILALPVATGDDDFADWIRSQVGPQ